MEVVKSLKSRHKRYIVPARSKEPEKPNGEPATQPNGHSPKSPTAGGAHQQKPPPAPPQLKPPPQISERRASATDSAEPPAAANPKANAGGAVVQRRGSAGTLLDAPPTGAVGTATQRVASENGIYKKATSFEEAERLANSFASPFKMHNEIFERTSKSTRAPPEMPTTENIEYPRAASWSSSTVEEILRDPMGRQVFRCFLFQALAEENLLFVEDVETLMKEKDGIKIRDGIKGLLNQYANYVNLSGPAMAKLKEASTSDTPDPKALELAHKEISKLLENDQFPRFRRSPIYIEYLEKLLPRAYAERWATSFDAMLGNQVGRHHFRQFLFSVHAEENLRFWEAVVEFRSMKNMSTAMINMGRNIQFQFLKEGGHNEVYLPFGVRQGIDKRIKDKDVDETLFDEAVKHVEQILKNDPYVRFLQSKAYAQLLAKLKVR